MGSCHIKVNGLVEHVKYWIHTRELISNLHDSITIEKLF